MTTSFVNGTSNKSSTLSPPVSHHHRQHYLHSRRGVREGKEEESIPSFMPKVPPFSPQKKYPPGKSIQMMSDAQTVLKTLAAFQVRTKTTPLFALDPSSYCEFIFSNFFFQYSLGYDNNVRSCRDEPYYSGSSPLCNDKFNMTVSTEKIGDFLSLSRNGIFGYGCLVGYSLPELSF